MKTKWVSILAVLLMFWSSAFSQDATPVAPVKEPKLNFKVTTDIVSTFIWRGTVASLNPNIQPTLAIVSDVFELGFWGSTDFRASYKELDPYVALTMKSFKLLITDYDWTFTNSSYFDYKNSTTDHIFEASLSFLGTEKVPLNVSVNTFIYGADKKWDKNSEEFSAKQNYSTYIEFGWAFKNCNIFLGVTPFNGYYGAGYGKVDGFAVCNLGLTAVHNIKITPDFQLPLKGTVYLNPQAESIHFVIGLTL